MKEHEPPGAVESHDVNSAIRPQKSMAIWENAVLAFDINSAFYTTLIKCVTGICPVVSAGFFLLRLLRTVFCLLQI